MMTIRRLNKDEQYVRNFKKILRRRGRYVRQPRNEKNSFQKERDDKKGKGDRKYFRCGDPNHVIREFPKAQRNKKRRAFIGGSWTDSGEEDGEKPNDETCLMDHA